MGPFGPLVYEFIQVKLGGGGCTNSCICMRTHSQPLLIRTACWMFKKLGKDEVLMAPYMH